ncbi:hypothetical protein DFW101_2887 [Solidesulfovibrio carbinoliphilus subsp. oakridgensis]|uniref:FAD-dependent pyridine nucleotide-disulfide oxidoreductase n=1 Tax=Solidesulfovibrio carbinoliphilus subsp. oakridgensis TaxID=694327 RepID=G7QBM6_9BACT|nr:hypothetical protein [Solidesulfovibrio carbinoliphilus]EHJ48889.1 hypothetical protein DFW101_2887 [Solidesulfovibrio carbinoliphilus subsp. oakridgensis]
MDDLLIIGGSDAGISAALRARELVPACTVTVVLADDYPNYSICGLPFFLSGEVPDWRALAHRTREDLPTALPWPDTWRTGIPSLPSSGAHRLRIRVTGDRATGSLIEKGARLPISLAIR